MLRTDYIKALAKDLVKEISKNIDEYMPEYDVEQITEQVIKLELSDLYTLQDTVDTLITFREEREQDDEE